MTQTKVLIKYLPFDKIQYKLYFIDSYIHWRNLWQKRKLLRKKRLIQM